MKFILRILFFAVLVFLPVILLTNLWMISATHSQLTRAEDIKNQSVVLVLGTSRYSVEGGFNRYFSERMECASRIYHNGMASHILVSGDNSSRFYNEPKEMTQALTELAIRREDITLDYAGFRTFDSIVRAKKVFGQDTILIVTQKFHCYRALFIANYYGIKAQAIPADEDTNTGIIILLREIVARTLAIADLYLFKKEPKFLGDEVKLPV